MKWFVTVILWWGALAAGLAAQPRAEARRPARIAGTRVSLAPPPGFVPSGQFPGYESEGEGASILVAEMSAPPAEVSPALADPAALAKKATVLLGREQVSVGGLPALLFHFKQTALGAEYRKWLLLFGDEKELVMITATFPAESEATLSAALRRSVLSARWHKGETVSPTEGLNFTLVESGGLKPTSRVGNVLAYTPGGVVPVKSVDDPLLVVGSSIGWGGTRDRKAFSEGRVFQIEHVTNVGVLETGAITVDGLEGYETLTRGNDRKTGEPVVVYQVMLFEGDTYYLMQGIVSARNSAAHLGTFKQMARSFRRVPKAAGSGAPPKP